MTEREVKGRDVAEGMEIWYQGKWWSVDLSVIFATPRGCGFDLLIGGPKGTIMAVGEEQLCKVRIHDALVPLLKVCENASALAAARVAARTANVCTK